MVRHAKNSRHQHTVVKEYVRSVQQTGVKGVRERPGFGTIKWIWHLQVAHLRQPLQGGLLISLDTGIWQCQPKWPNQSLALFQISPDLVNLITHIYRCTTFQFHHRGETKTFDTTRGIRQGCKAAPILWCIYIGWIMHRYLSDAFCIAMARNDQTMYPNLLHTTQHGLDALVPHHRTFDAILDFMPFGFVYFAFVTRNTNSDYDRCFCNTFWCFLLNLIQGIRELIFQTLWPLRKIRGVE